MSRVANASATQRLSSKPANLRNVGKLPRPSGPRPRVVQSTANDRQRALITIITGSIVCKQHRISRLLRSSSTVVYARVSACCFLVFVLPHHVRLSCNICTDWQQLRPRTQQEVVSGSMGSSSSRQRARIEEQQQTSNGYTYPPSNVQHTPQVTWLTLHCTAVGPFGANRCRTVAVPDFYRQFTHAVSHYQHSWGLYKRPAVRGIPLPCTSICQRKPGSVTAVTRRAQCQCQPV